MSQVRFIGCLHFGHAWMANHRGWGDLFYHDEKIVDTWNQTVGKRDLTYILGDVTMENNIHYHQLDRLNGRKVVVLGNHDLKEHVRDLLKYVETVAGMIDYKGYCLTHCPIHPNEISFYEGNIHAHIHENKLHEVLIKDRYGDKGNKTEFPTLYKYYNVDAHLINYKPRTLEEIVSLQK
jgi:calcineurin-like phosphoesterase family protein